MKNLQRFLMTFAVLAIIFGGCDKDDDNAGPYYTMVKLSDLELELPHQINILFQVTDKNNIGVANLTSDNFQVKEDGLKVGSEGQITITPRNQVAITLKTILLIDISLSVEGVFDDIKTAAKELITQMPDYQQVELQVFSTNPSVVQVLTSDKDLLKTAIDNLKIGTSSTNLYGVLVNAGNTDIWETEYSTDAIREGNLICFTDGNHTTGNEFTKEQAITALLGKKVYMLGLGNELDQNIMRQLGEFHHAADVTKLKDVFINIQENIENTANSYYWLYYQSPKRGDFDYNLQLEIIGNSNTSPTGYFSDTFNAKYFTD